MKTMNEQEHHKVMIRDSDGNIIDVKEDMFSKEGLGRENIPIQLTEKEYKRLVEQDKKVERYDVNLKKLGRQLQKANSEFLSLDHELDMIKKEAYVKGLYDAVQIMDAGVEEDEAMNERLEEVKNKEYQLTELNDREFEFCNDWKYLLRQAEKAERYERFYNDVIDVLRTSFQEENIGCIRDELQGGFGKIIKKWDLEYEVEGEDESE